jgi:hypothetical protein
MILMADENLSKLESKHLYTLDARATLFLENICHTVKTKYPTLPMDIVEDIRLEQTMENMWNESHNLEKLNEIRYELESTKRILSDTIKTSLDRGEKLEDMDYKCKRLSEVSALYRKEGSACTKLITHIVLTADRLKRIIPIHVAQLCDSM